MILAMLKDWILGVELVSVDDAREAFENALDACDKDKDGMLSIRELISLFRAVMKNGS